MKNDTLPGPCVFCGKEKKPSFVEYYCECRDEEITERLSLDPICVHGYDFGDCRVCHIDYRRGVNLSVGAIAPQACSYKVIRGHVMTHFIECMHCNRVAIYSDHDPRTRQGELISETNGWFQLYNSSIPGTRILCDSCDTPLDINNLIDSYIHQY